jgi:hypothetical protein
MKGATLTRADLCEAVHEEVGLTRQDCAGLVERTLDLVAEALERAKRSSFPVSVSSRSAPSGPAWAAIPRPASRPRSNPVG